VAVTVPRVSVVDRMVSKEYVQTARPYDRDLASPGAWIETGLSSRDPRWVTVAAFATRLCQAMEYSRSVNSAREKNMRALTTELACGGVMLQDQSSSGLAQRLSSQR
jgi:hypothetical protein